jgi:hypothetical protein
LYGSRIFKPYLIIRHGAKKIKDPKCCSFFKVEKGRDALLPLKEGAARIRVNLPPARFPAQKFGHRSAGSYEDERRRIIAQKLPMFSGISEKGKVARGHLGRIHRFIATIQGHPAAGVEIPKEKFPPGKFGEQVAAKALPLDVFQGPHRILHPDICPCLGA